ncbi:hypothetical protein [Marivirga lumbricoides]
MISTAACLFLITQGKLLTESIIGLLMSGGLLVYMIKEDEYYEWLKRFRRKKFNCRIESDHFYFPNGYYFRHGFLKRSKKLPFSKVQELRTNTHPVSALVNNNELIFLLGIESKDVLAHDQLSIKAKQRNDNWSLLCEEFLDTEFSEALQKTNIAKLEKAGISKEEQQAIKKRLKVRFLIRTMVTWEWVYYGQYDVLCELWPLTQKKYWWTMDVALRKNELQQVL